MLTGIIFLALSAGLVPFFSYSVKLTGSGATAGTSGSFPRLLYRLVGHPAVSVDLPAIGLLFGGIAGLIALGAWPRRRRDASELAADAGIRRFRPDLMAVPIALILGLGVTFLAGLKVKTFDVYKPSYSLWAIPALCIIGGCAFAPGLGRRLQGLAAFCIVSAVLGSGWSQGVILNHRSAFSHGPQGALAAMIDSLPERRKLIIVHDEGGITWALVYFPLRLVYGNDLEQYLLPSEGTEPPERRALKPLCGPTRSITLEEIGPDRPVLVIRGSMMGQAELRREIRRGGEPVPSGALIERLEGLPGWSKTRELRFFAYVSAQARLFVHRAADLAPTPEARP